MRRRGKLFEGGLGLSRGGKGPAKTRRRRGRGGDGEEDGQRG